MSEGNGIVRRQLQEHNLQRLAAQRELYTRGKLILGIQLTLNIIVIVFISVLALVFKSQKLMQILGLAPIDMSWLVTVSGVLITIIDVVILAPLVDKCRGKAAKIQEAFDCDVLSLPWNSITVGEQLSQEEIYVNANKFKMERGSEGFQKLRNWYCIEADTVPLNVARIICQRSNVWWDAELRTKFNQWLIVTSAILFGILLGLAIWGNLTIIGFFTKVIAPFMPMLIFSVRQSFQNNQTITTLDRLRKSADGAYDKGISEQISDSELIDISRRLQDNVYVHREKSPLIFDWFYRRYKNLTENTMNASCVDLVNRYWKSRGERQDNTL